MNRKTKTRLALTVVFLLFLLWALVKVESETGGPRARTQTLRLGQAVITAEIADTNAARMRGLSGRPALPAGQGMLFVFPRADRYGIWMEDMKFALDILWLEDAQKDAHNDASGKHPPEALRIVDMREDVSPASFPEVFYPVEPALYALEVPAGAVRQSAVKVGDMAWRE